MIQITKSMIINKPINDVWKLMYGEFADVGKWVTGVYSSRPVTKEENYDRVCDTFTGKLYEKLLSVDEKNYTYVVDAKGLPKFVKSFTGRWKFDKISDNKTKATLNLTIETKGILGAILQIPLKFQLNKGLNELHSDLSTYMETGKPSASKQKEIRKKKK